MPRHLASTSIPYREYMARKERARRRWKIAEVVVTVLAIAAAIGLLYYLA